MDLGSNHALCDIFRESLLKTIRPLGDRTPGTQYDMGGLVSRRGLIALSMQRDSSSIRKGLPWAEAH
eukprot:scaffold34834_cov63-Cyclotella_meneghiniana.AAC.2